MGYKKAFYDKKILDFEQNDDTLCQSIYHYFVNIAPKWFENREIPFIFAYQNTPMPKRPFGTIYLVHKQLQSVKNNTYRKIDGVLYEIKEFPTNVTFHINVYGENAKQILSDLLIGLDDPVTSEYFYQRNIVFLNITNIISNDNLINKSWENRMKVSLTFFVNYMYKRAILPAEWLEINQIKTLELNKQ